MQAGEGFASFGCEGVEVGEELLAGFEGCGGEWGGGHIHHIGGEDVGAESTKGGDVDGEVAHGHGLVVTLEGGVAFGDALEGGASALHLSVEVLQEDFGDSHVAWLL